MPKNAPKMAFLACFGISKRRDRCYASFGTFWDPKNLVLMPKNAKKLICIFCLFVRAEMTSRHKNSSKTLQNTPKMVQNSINGLNIYIGSPSKKKKRKILTQGKSCFFYCECYQWNIWPIYKSLIKNFWNTKMFCNNFYFKSDNIIVDDHKKYYHRNQKQWKLKKLMIPLQQLGKDKVE